MTVDVDSQTFIDQAQNKIWFYIENLAFCEYDILSYIIVTVENVARLSWEFNMNQF